MISSISTAAFIKAFRSYAALRSCPRKVFIDRGTNLISGKKVLRKVLRDLDWSKIQEVGTEKGFDWHFTSAARSASFNGSVEIVVKLFKKALYRALQFDRKLKTPLKLSLTQFRTICLEAAQLVNDRPLSRCSDHRDNLSHVSPNKLVFGKPSQVVPLKMSGKEIIEQGLYKECSKILHLFLIKFKSTYQREMNINRHWLEKFDDNIEAGTLVHYRDGQHMKPGQFQIGVVVEALKHADGRIKTLTLRMPSNKNPITRDLCQCFLSDKDFDKLTNVVHSCLLQQDQK